MEVHYIDTGFPYTPTESFMDFFEGLTHAPVNYGHAMPMHDQACLVFPSRVFMLLLESDIVRLFQIDVACEFGPVW